MHIHQHVIYVYGVYYDAVHTKLLPYLAPLFIRGFIYCYCMAACLTNGKHEHI